MTWLLRLLRPPVLVLIALVMPSDARADGAAGVRTYSTAEGLPHYAINRILRDSRGYVWFCTREGLARFDGYSFATYRTSDGLPSANVTDILENPDGTFWIGTLEGLVFFDPAARPASTRHARQLFTTVKPPGDSRTAAISKIARDPAGTIWIGTAGGLFRLEYTEGVAEMRAIDLGIADEFNETQVRTVIVDRRGALWIGAGPGFFVRMADGSITRLTHAEGLPQTAVLDIREDRAGRIWAATTNGLWRLEVAANGRPRLAQSFGILDGLPHPWVITVFERADGSLWVGTPDGLARAEPNSDPANLRFIPAEGGNGPVLHVTQLAEDESANLWIGTSTDGALRLSGAGFSTFGHEHDIVEPRSIIETTPGEVAFLARRGHDWAVFCSDGQRVRSARPRGPLGDLSWAWNQVLLHDSAGDWWIGTSNGIFRFTGARSCTDLDGRQPAQRFDSRTGLAADVAIRLFEDSRGDVWMATVGHGVRPDGLSRWERRTGRVVKYTEQDGLPTFARHFVSALGEDKAGNVWIGFSLAAGLARFRNGRFELFTQANGVPAGQIRDLMLDAKGRLWIGSYRRGLARVDDPAADLPIFRTYGTAEGLSSNEAHAIVADQSGRIYVGSASGLDRLDPESGLIRRYSQDDGAPAGDLNGALRDSHGTLWFLHQGGVVRFVPGVERPGRPPRVLITGLTINGGPLPISELGETHVGPLSLPADSNSVRIAFVALGQRSGDYFFRYKFDRDGSAWSRFSHDRSINFANLAPGTYRLLVDARDSDGRTAEQPAVVAFTIVPPLWQQRWAVALIAVAIAGAAYTLHRYRLRRVVEIARIRDRIAADLHDDLGANLTKIAVLGEAARQQAVHSEGALGSIAGIARDSIASMSDIVWAIDPARDTLEDLVRRMRQHAFETFALGDVELTFDAPKHLERRTLGSELRHDLLLLFKEAVNNVARHSACRQVRIVIGIDRGDLTLEVSDDGVGFAPSELRDGHGMGTMRRRAARMGATLEIVSAPGRGTSITLRMRLA